jgi:hypothetical protein
MPQISPQENIIPNAVDTNENFEDTVSQRRLQHGTVKLRQRVNLSAETLAKIEEYRKAFKLKYGENATVSLAINHLIEQV